MKISHYCLNKTSFTLVFFLGVKFPNQASSICFTSKGPTAGLLSFTESSEEKPPAATETEEMNEVNSA